MLTTVGVQTSYTDTVSAATTCYYRVVAVNAAGGTASNVSQVTTPPEQQKASLRMLDFQLKPGQALGGLAPVSTGHSA